MQGYLTILFLCVSLILAKSENSFIASFQSSGEWLKDEWIEYNHEIPLLTEFTACHWEKVQYFSEQINTVWAYCMFVTKDDSKMRCVEVYYLFSSNIGGNIDFKGWFDGWSDEALYIEFKNVSYRHRAWNHFCWSYSGKTGMNTLYHNGQLVGTISLLDYYGIYGPLIQGTRTVYESAFIIGQEPDSMRGDYKKSQAFPGQIAELNIWNRILEKEEISKMATCKRLNKGNVVTWEKDKLKFSIDKIIDVEEFSIFCEQETLHVIFPQRFSLDYGRPFCSPGGYP